MNPLAALPWAVMHLDHGIRRVLRGFGGAWLLVVALLVTATVPLTMVAARQQPLGETVDGLRDGVSSMATWVRMSGEITTITSPDNVAAGYSIQSLLVEPSGDAILLVSDRLVDDLDEVTGRVTNSANSDEVARSVAGPRLPAGDLDIIDGYLVEVDDVIVPPGGENWWPVWGLLALAALLVIGLRTGYPVLLLRRARGAVTLPAAEPLRVGEAVDLRLVDREEENGLRSSAPHGTFRRLPRREATDPYFSLQLPTVARPMEFRRHRWSAAEPGTLYYVGERVPVLSVHDWGVDALLAFTSEADRARVHASFVHELDDGIGDAEDQAERAPESAAHA